jgi:Transcriptional regulator/sugar kinase
VAQDALHRVGDWLGIGVANLINLFNPGLVIFGGMLREVYLGSAAQVRSRIAANVLVISREKVRLDTSALGDDATLIGAAELAFSEVLASPPGSARPYDVTQGRTPQTGAGPHDVMIR